jgi:hypothetical protein
MIAVKMAYQYRGRIPEGSKMMITVREAEL